MIKYTNCERYVVSLLLLMIATLAACSAQTSKQRLSNKIERYLAANQIPGAMVSIVRSDTVLMMDGFGYANVEIAEAVGPQHLFRLGSISKSFTAMGLIKLLASTPFTLNSPIKEIDPDLDFENNWFATDPITVAHLLEHTSGFEDFHLHAIYNTTDDELPPVIETVKDHQNSLHARWRPGTIKAYANPNYILAGHLIELLSGQPYDEYIRQEILDPMKLTHAGFYFKEATDRAVASAYRRNGQEVDPIPFATINGGPAGDFCGSAEDMATYLQIMLRQDTALFSKATYTRIETPATSLAARNGLTAGYGLGNYTIWKQGYLFNGHGGEIDGFASRYLYSREADLGVSVAVNRNANANELADEILKIVLADQENRKIPKRKVVPIPNSLKAEYAGFYEFKNSKSELLAFSDRMFAGLTLDFKHDKVVTRSLLGRTKDTLFYAGNNQFYRGAEEVPSILLLKNQSGKSVLWINDSYTEQESRLKRLVIFFGLLLSLILLSSFLLYHLVWFTRQLFMDDKPGWTNRLILFGAIVCLLLLNVGFGMSVSNPQGARSITPGSLMLYLSSYLMVALTILSVYRWRSVFSSAKFKAYYIITSVASVMVSIYLWDSEFIGLQLWNY